MDFLRPLPIGEEILVLVDYYSKFYDLEVMQKTTIKALVARLEIIFAHFEYPNVAVCDNFFLFV